VFDGFFYTLFYPGCSGYTVKCYRIFCQNIVTNQMVECSRTYNIGMPKGKLVYWVGLQILFMF